MKIILKRAAPKIRLYLTRKKVSSLIQHLLIHFLQLILFSITKTMSKKKKQRNSKRKRKNQKTILKILHNKILIETINFILFLHNKIKMPILKRFLRLFAPQCSLSMTTNRQSPIQNLIAGCMT